MHINPPNPPTSQSSFSDSNSLASLFQPGGEFYYLIEDLSNPQNQTDLNSIVKELNYFMSQISKSDPQYYQAFQTLKNDVTNGASASTLLSDIAKLAQLPNPKFTASQITQAWQSILSDMINTLNGPVLGGGTEGAASNFFAIFTTLLSALPNCPTELQGLKQPGSDMYRFAEDMQNLISSPSSANQEAVASDLETILSKL